MRSKRIAAGAGFGGRPRLCHFVKSLVFILSTQVAVWLFAQRSPSRAKNTLSPSSGSRETSAANLQDTPYQRSPQSCSQPPCNPVLHAIPRRSISRRAYLAVGVVIGAAFGAIVASLVADIIMPIVGAVTGGLDFSNYYLPLSSKVQAGLSYADAKKAGAVLGYGQFLTIALNFLIVAFVLFIRYPCHEQDAAQGRCKS